MWINCSAWEHTLGMSWTVRVVGILMGLAAAYVVEHTVSTARGVSAPLVLIGS